MSDKTSLSIHLLRRVLLAGSLAALLNSPFAVAQGLCETALASSGGSITLLHGDPEVITNGIDEWDSEIIKGKVTGTGLLDVSGLGPDAEARLYTGSPAGGTFHLVDLVTVGTEHRVLTSGVESADYCLEFIPAAGGSGDLDVELLFLDACQVGDPDDHGDSFSCATAATVGGSSPTGSISTGDHDLFWFVLGSTETVEVESSGTTDVAGALFDEDGALIEEDDDDGAGSNFFISGSLAAGTYYVRVAGSGSAQGSYTVSFTVP